MTELRKNAIEKELSTIISETEVKKVEQIASLMLLAEMTLTEINTLTENERILLSEIFVVQREEEMKIQKKHQH
jgi:hypothetical protein